MELRWEKAICDTFGLSEGLRQFQKQVLAALLEKKDVFLSVKTGSGKSLCYQGFPLAREDTMRQGGVVEHQTIVLIISPLNAIMEEQVRYSIIIIM